MSIRTLRLAVFTAMSLTISGVSGAQRLTGPNPTGDVPSPVNLDTHGQFQEKFVSVGSDMFISGQPTEQGLRELRARGVTTVVNLRTPEEMSKRVPFDEAAVVKKLGMEYIYIPMRGNAEFPYSPAAVDKFAAAMASSRGKVLLHCTIAWRASHLWAAYLIHDRGVPVATALDDARIINLMDNMRMDDAQQPVESFLGRSLPEVGHPKK